MIDLSIESKNYQIKIIVYCYITKKLQLYYCVYSNIIMIVLLYICYKLQLFVVHHHNNNNKNVVSN